MKIINTSLYEPKKLRTLYCFIHKLISKDEGRLPHWGSLEIKVMGKTLGNNYSGTACVGKIHHSRNSDQTDMWLSMNINCSIYEIAQLFAHELMHSYGYEHHQFHTDPLTKDQMKSIEDRFSQPDLLLEKAFKTSKKGVSYKAKCSELEIAYDWLCIDHLDYLSGEGFILEVTDTRVDHESSYEYRAEYWRAVSWKGAYDMALDLIKEKWQIEFTENWTINISEEELSYD